jgi:hypothetical protein
MLRMQEMFQISKIFWGVCPQTPYLYMICRPGYPPLIYYLTERSLFKKCPPPKGKSLKKGRGLKFKKLNLVITEWTSIFISFE